MVDPLILAGKAVFAWGIALSFIPLLIWFERKGSAFIQDRVGPNRAAVLGFRLGGFLHNIADVVKLMMKELVVPERVNRFYFVIAPCLGITFVLAAFAAVPFADDLVVAGRRIPVQVSDLNAGLLYIFAVTSLNVYGIVLAGWSSNNKFSLLGGLRSAAQMISYEIPLGLAIIGVFMVYGSAGLADIVKAQGSLLFGFLPRWGIFIQPLGFLLFLAAAFAETNRNPFDLPEGESEIVAGYHVEYSGVRFALFYMGEYVAIVLSAVLITSLFFGGWQIPYAPTTLLVAHAGVVLEVMLLAVAAAALPAVFAFFSYGRRLKGTWGDVRDREGYMLAVLAAALGGAALVAAVKLWQYPLGQTASHVVVFIAQLGAFLAKVLFFAWFFIWVRWTLPRFRYDQLMRLGWKSLIPLSLLNILVTAAVLLALPR